MDKRRVSPKPHAFPAIKIHRLWFLNGHIIAIYQDNPGEECMYVCMKMLTFLFNFWVVPRVHQHQRTRKRTCQLTKWSQRNISSVIKST